MKAAAVERLTPGEAMDQHRLGAVPGADEGDQIVEMRMVRQHLAGHRRDDVRHREIEVPLRRDLGRAVDRRARAQQGDQRTRAGSRGDFADQGQRADVQARHRGFSGTRRFSHTGGLMPTPPDDPRRSPGFARRRSMAILMTAASMTGAMGRDRGLPPLFPARSIFSIGWRSVYRRRRRRGYFTFENYVIIFPKTSARRLSAGVLCQPRWRRVEAEQQDAGADSAGPARDARSARPRAHDIAETPRRF